MFPAIFTAFAVAVATCALIWWLFESTVGKGSVPLNLIIIMGALTFSAGASIVAFSSAGPRVIEERMVLNEDGVGATVLVEAVGDHLRTEALLASGIAGALCAFLSIFVARFQKRKHGGASEASSSLAPQSAPTYSAPPSQALSQAAPAYSAPPSQAVPLSQPASLSQAAPAYSAPPSQAPSHAAPAYSAPPAQMPVYTPPPAQMPVAQMPQMPVAQMPVAQMPPPSSSVPLPRSFHPSAPVPSTVPPRQVPPGRDPKDR